MQSKILLLLFLLLPLVSAVSIEQGTKTISSDNNSSVLFDITTIASRIDITNNSTKIYELVYEDQNIKCIFKEPFIYSKENSKIRISYLIKQRLLFEVRRLYESK